MDQQAIKAPLRAKIEELRTKIAGYSVTLGESRIAQAKMSEIYKDPKAAAELFKGKSEEANQIFEDSRMAGDVDTLDMYLHTMDQQLMKCDKAMVITDTNRLMSPSGFHPTDRVFLQTKIAIHCDSIPKRLPSVNCEIFGHKLTEIEN